MEGEKKRMMEARTKGSSHWWWFENNDKANSNRSPWLQTTLSELNEKTKHMLKLIEEDADSFAVRAEWLYKKRPELIILVEDFYRTHRSLAERYDLAKSESGNNRLLSLTKNCLGKSLSFNGKTLNEKQYDTSSEGEDEFGGSEVDDPEGEEIVADNAESQTQESSCSSKDDSSNITNNNTDYDDEDVSCNDNNINNEELMRLREEVERLREENKLQREQLMQKDEEKRHVIRQLSLAMDFQREENLRFVKFVAEKFGKKESPKKGRLFYGLIC